MYGGGEIVHRLCTVSGEIVERLCTVSGDMLLRSRNVPPHLSLGNTQSR